jgi:hypothetical protein
MAIRMGQRRGARDRESLDKPSGQESPQTKRLPSGKQKASLVLGHCFGDRDNRRGWCLVSRQQKPAIHRYGTAGYVGEACHSSPCLACVSRRWPRSGEMQRPRRTQTELRSRFLQWGFSQAAARAMAEPEVEAKEERVAGTKTRRQCVEVQLDSPLPCFPAPACV